MDTSALFCAVVSGDSSKAPLGTGLSGLGVLLSSSLGRVEEFPCQRRGGAILIHLRELY